MKDHWEIERRFRVRADLLPPLGHGERILQAYLGFEPVVRVRLSEARGYLTVKGAGLLRRREVETEIGADVAEALLELRSPGTVVLRKTRHPLNWCGFTWEVDVFEGDLQGLLLAEVELASEEVSPPLPPWAEQEVTGDPAYQNANLARAGSPLLRAVGRDPPHPLGNVR